jgi:hypothetical protein
MVSPALLPIALLGTRRATFSFAQVPEAIRTPLESVVFPDSESALLSVLACDWAAGQLNWPSVVPQPQTAAPIEKHPCCSAAAAELWMKIRDLDTKNTVLEELWLNQCAQQGQVIAPAIVPSVLQLYASRKCTLRLFRQIETVLSERARWLIPQNPAWQRTKPPAEPKRPDGDLDPAKVRLELKNGAHHIITSDLGLLPEDEREQVLIDGVHQHGDSFSQHIPWHAESLHFHWSPVFSQWILQHLYQSWGGYYFHNIQLILPLHVWLHPDVDPAAIPQLQDSMSQRDRWLQIVVPEIEAVRQLKKQLL